MPFLMLYSEEDIDHRQSCKYERLHEAHERAKAVEYDRYHNLGHLSESPQDDVICRYIPKQPKIERQNSQQETRNFNRKNQPGQVPSRAAKVLQVVNQPMFANPVPIESYKDD